jgi:hypothetical protein
VQHHLRHTAAVVHDDALAALRDRSLFKKLEIMDFEFRHRVARLLHQGVVVTLFEAYNFDFLVSLRQERGRANLEFCASIQDQCWLTVLCSETRPNAKPQNIVHHALKNFWT